MKKVLIMMVMLLSGAAYSTDLQTDLQKKKADYYAAEAVKYFDLDESKKEAIANAKLDLIVAQKEMQQKKKSGELKKSDEKQYRKENVYPYTKKVMDAIGVNWEELKPFNEKVHPAMNKLKM